MYDILNVYLDGSKEPSRIEMITADVWCYADLADKAKAKQTVAPMQLTIAYCQIVGEEPPDLATVRKWAREHRVQVEVAETVGPTPPDPIEGSSSR